MDTLTIARLNALKRKRKQLNKLLLIYIKEDMPRESLLRLEAKIADICLRISRLN